VLEKLRQTTEKERGKMVLIDNKKEPMPVHVIMPKKGQEAWVRQKAVNLLEALELVELKPHRLPLDTLYSSPGCKCYQDAWRVGGFPEPSVLATGYLPEDKATAEEKLTFFNSGPRWINNLDYDAMESWRWQHIYQIPRLSYNTVTNLIKTVGEA
jgi:hypothetical protein